MPCLARIPFVAASLALAAGVAVADPELDAAASDALGQLIAERGLAPAAAVAAGAPLLQRARDRGAEIVVGALAFLGTPYRRGGDGDGAFDCSGFTRHVFETGLGLVLPRRADEQAMASGLVAIGREQLRPGDLVFFNTLRRTFSHVGIYVGDGKFVHAPRPGGGVRVEDMRFAYWAKRFTGARRAVDLAEAPAAANP